MDAGEAGFNPDDYIVEPTNDDDASDNMLAEMDPNMVATLLELPQDPPSTADDPKVAPHPPVSPFVPQVEVDYNLAPAGGNMNANPYYGQEVYTPVPPVSQFVPQAGDDVNDPPFTHDREDTSIMYASLYHGQDRNVLRLPVSDFVTGRQTNTNNEWYVFMAYMVEFINIHPGCPWDIRFPMAELEDLLKRSLGRQRPLRDDNWSRYSLRGDNCSRVERVIYFTTYHNGRGKPILAMSLTDTGRTKGQDMYDNYRIGETAVVVAEEEIGETYQPGVCWIRIAKRPGMRPIQAAIGTNWSDLVVA